MKIDEYISVMVKGTWEESEEQLNTLRQYVEQVVLVLPSPDTKAMVIADNVVFRVEEYISSCGMVCDGNALRRLRALLLRRIMAEGIMGHEPLVKPTSEPFRPRVLTLVLRQENAKEIARALRDLANAIHDGNLVSYCEKDGCIFLRESSADMCGEIAFAGRYWGVACDCGELKSPRVLFLDPNEANAYSHASGNNGSVIRCDVAITAWNGDPDEDPHKMTNHTREDNQT